MLKKKAWADLFGEMFDRSQASTDAPHIIQTYHLPLHGQQHCSTIQSHSGKNNKNSWTTDSAI